MKITDKIIFFGLFIGLLFVSLNRHSHHPIFDYHSQLFADKAGYHVYAPAFFYYHMDAANLPEDIVGKTGNGFRISEGKIITKYPIGVAICQSPFFGAAAVYDKVIGKTDNLGFTESHHLALNWSTAIWGIFGLVLIFLTAIRHWNLSRGRAYLLVCMLLFASNLLYYMTRDCGMSHTYSFTVFAAIQYVLFGSIKRLEVKSSELVSLLFLFALVVALRPLNLVFISLPILYLLLTFKDTIAKIKFKLKWYSWLISICVAAVPILLQIAYNYYAYGKPFADSYANETFSNVNNLDILALWFAPNNGALLYSPVLLLVFVGIVKLIRNGNYRSTLYILYFVVISVTYAAWWSPELGCGFGHRGFTEHLAFFALPIVGYLASTSKSTIKVLSIFTVLLACLLFIAQFNFDGCWQATSDWDWAAFFRLLRF